MDGQHWCRAGCFRHLYGEAGRQVKRSEMEKKLQEAGFNFTLDETDLEGQILIYTGLKLADESDDPEVVEFTESGDSSTEG